MKYEELSKEVSYALRHAPWEYELEMDEEGWVSIEQLADGRMVSPPLEDLTPFLSDEEMEENMIIPRIIE